MKNVIGTLALFLLPIISYAGPSGETVCGHVERSRYCRDGTCQPFHYEVELSGHSPDRFALLNSSDFLSQLDQVANTGAAVCLNGYAFSFESAAPGDFHITGILNSGNSSSDTQTTITGFLTRWKSVYLFSAVADNPQCQKAKQIDMNRGLCLSDTQLLALDRTQFEYNNGSTIVDPIEFEALNAVVQLTGNMNGTSGRFEVNEVHVIDN